MSVNVHTEVQLSPTNEKRTGSATNTPAPAKELEVPVPDESTTRIPLAGGQFALVDAIDAARLQHHKWQPVDIDGRTHARNASGRVMQRMILYGTDTIVHLNGDTLDNRRSNLRFRHQIVKDAPVRLEYQPDARHDAPRPAKAKVKRQPAPRMTEDGTGVLVPLTQGIYALIDPADWPAVSQYSWHYSSGGYAKNGRVGSMHRFIMQPATRLVVDHINRDRLDNRRSNLRICTQTQNKSNIPMRPSNTSGYRGVIRQPRGWIAQISAGSDAKFVVKGPFDTAEDAARAYDTMALEMRGEFAVLNFPTTPAPTSPRPKADAETRIPRQQASNPRVGHATPPRFARGGPTDRRLLPAFDLSKWRNAVTASRADTSPAGDTDGEVQS